MMRLRFLVPVLGLASFSLLVVACGDDDDTAGAGGAGGEAPTTPGNGGAGGDSSPAAGGEPAAGGACSGTGTGTLVFDVTGLPDGVMPDISTTGSDELAVTDAGPIDANAGELTVSAARVFDADPTVRTVFDATVTAPSFCLADGESHTVKITYTAIPSSNKLWMPSGEDSELAGFSSADIATTVMTDPSVSIHTPGAVSVAFDQDGNLWAVGTTIGGDMLVRVPAADLGETGTREPDIKITVPAIICYPFIGHIAFDATGNLWLSACNNEVRRLNATDLTTSGEKESDVLLTGVTNNGGLAFDADGNLWVAGGPKLLRFDAARLDTTDADPADLSLTITEALDTTVIGADELAFDKTGNLWGISGSTVFQLAAAKLTGTGAVAVKAKTSFDVDVLALPSTPAFDDSGALWIALSTGTFGQYSPTQLTKSVAAGTPVVPSVLISSDGVTSGLPIAFFPAAAGLPLYHSLPTP